MSDLGERALLAGVVLGLALAYLACGMFIAMLFGLAEWTVSWIVVTLAWPAPLGLAIFCLMFATSISLTIARAVVR